jgi:hypothetical protein
MDGSSYQRRIPAIVDRYAFYIPPVLARDTIRREAGGRKEQRGARPRWNILSHRTHQETSA